MKKAAYLAAKRALDLLVSTVGLIVGAPMFLLLAAVIRWDSPGPALYRQVRVGRSGVSFKMIKFRSMRSDAEGGLEPALEGDPIARSTWEQRQKLHRDPRLTRVGRLLRRTSLDELPQLWNVLRGEMSLVGPRPILPSQREMYGPSLQSLVELPPGVTGLWQVSGRNQLSFAERVELDQRYARERSFWLDLRILGRTIVVVLRGEGAF